MADHSPSHPQFPSNLPNFFIIGSAKSGTTTLFGALVQEPQIFMSRPKETNFFCDNRMYAKGLDWYAKTFFPNSEQYPARGEGSTRYLNWGEKVAPRIAEMDKDDQVKLIAIFRDPVKRAYSNYWYAVRYGWEKLSFEEAIRTEDQRLSQNWDDLSSIGENDFTYFRQGCYASRLRPFLEIFPRERILLLLQEDLIQDYQGTIARITDFLGVTSQIEHVPSVLNPFARYRSHFLRKMLSNPSAVRTFITLLLPLSLRTRLKDRLRKANKEVTKYPPMSPEMESLLRDRYRDETAAFEKIIGRDLSHWY
jgi:hypothetical protein